MRVLSDIYNFVQQYWIVAFAVAILFTMLENFIPIIPLACIVAANSVALGFIPGLTASIIGSVVGSILLYNLAEKIRNSMFFKKMDFKRIDKINSWIKKQDFKMLSALYSCPFVPGCIFTLSLGLSGRMINTFISPLISGKLIYFFIICYVASDFNDFISSPFKILILISFIIITMIIGKKISLRVG